MKIPKKVKICGLNYTIRFNDSLHIKEGLQGTLRENQLEIILQNKDYNFQKVEQTFWHEIFHAIDLNYCNNELTEKQVDNIANGLYQVLKDNHFLKDNNLLE